MVLVGVLLLPYAEPLQTRSCTWPGWATTASMHSREVHECMNHHASGLTRYVMLFSRFKQSRSKLINKICPAL